LISLDYFPHVVPGAVLRREKRGENEVDAEVTRRRTLNEIKGMEIPLHPY
jgi:hypothetical protein